MNPLGSIFWVHFYFSKVDLVNDLSVIVLQITAKKNLFQLNETDFFLSLLSDSNQRPRDYKSRALAN